MNTYFPHRKKYLRAHGFRKRMATKGGRRIVNRRRAKKRSTVSVQ